MYCSVREMYHSVHGCSIEIMSFCNYARCLMNNRRHHSVHSSSHAINAGPLLTLVKCKSANLKHDPATDSSRQTSDCLKSG